MVQFCISNILYIPALSCPTSTALQIEQRRCSSACSCTVQKRAPRWRKISSFIEATRIGPRDVCGFFSQIQSTRACKLQTGCKTLRLGAAEEGLSSCREEKLKSTSSGKGGILQGAENELQKAIESDMAWTVDRIVDEEGNINNIEQECHTHDVGSPCEEIMRPAVSEVSARCTGGHLDNSVEPGNRDQNPVHEHLSASSEASNFSPTFKTSSPKMEGPCSRTMDWRLMAERDHDVSLPTSNIWPGKSSIRGGDEGEAVVEDVHDLPSLQKEGEISPPQLQEREKYGWSEVSCDDGSLSRKKSEELNGGEAMQEENIQQSEEKVFQEDTGRTPDDYHRRADLFGKSAEQFVARKHREERGSV